MTIKLPDVGDSRDEQVVVSQASRDSATIVAFIFLVLCGIGFLGLIVAVLPDAAFLLLLLAGVIGFFALHYYTWGRWLTKRLRESGEMQDGDF